MEREEEVVVVGEEVVEEVEWEGEEWELEVDMEVGMAAESATVTSS